MDPSLLSGIELDQVADDELTADADPAPCPASGAGDAIQVSTGIADGGDPAQIVPTLPLFATAPAAGGGSGTSTPGRSSMTVAAPARLDLRRARAGVRVVISHARAGTVTVTLALGRRIVAHATARARASGPMRLVLTPRGTHARHLRAGARLSLTVTDGTARIVDTIRLRGRTIRQLTVDWARSR